MGNEQPKCVERPTLDDMGSKSAETVPLEIEAKRQSLNKKPQQQHPRTPQPTTNPRSSYFIETRPNLRPKHAQALHNTSKKASARRSSHNYIYNGGAGLITTNNANNNTLDYLEPDVSSPSLSPETNMNPYGSNSATYSTSGDTEYCESSIQSRPKLSIHKRSQSNNPPTRPTLEHRKSAQSMRSTERERERKKKSKKKKRKKSKMKKMRSLQDGIDHENEMAAKYISQQVETQYLKKQNEELKRQNMMLRQKFMSIEDDDDEKQLPEIPDKSDPIQYQTQHRVSWKQSASPESNAVRKKSRNSKVKLKISGKEQRAMLRGSTNDQREDEYHAQIVYQARKPMVAVAPRPSLQPIYSKDDGQQFDEHILLKDKASGRGRYYSDGSILIPDGVMTDGIKMGISMDSMVNGHSENIWNLSFDGKCESVEKCIAIQRIIFALKWYSNAHGDADVVWKKIRDKRYGAHLITDYHHVMHYHLNRGDPKAIQHEKMQICGLIYKFISKCDANLCLGYKRKQIESLENNNNNPQSKSVRVQHEHHNNGGHVPFYVNCMDTIHCYFMHFPSAQFNNNN